MRLYRIAPEKYLQRLQGRGASYQTGARWNTPGQPVLYFALSPSVAMLEMANYLPSPRLIPKSYQLGIYEVPDDIPIKKLNTSELPQDWNDYPYPKSTQEIGGKWLEQGKELALIVPSAAVPQGLEASSVFNPRHPRCTEIQLIDSIDKIYSKRTFAKLIK